MKIEANLPKLTMKEKIQLVQELILKMTPEERREIWSRTMERMNDEFESKYQCEFPVDPIFDLYVKAWEAYNEAADRIDGHIEYPMTKVHHEIIGAAYQAGIRAFKETIPDGDMYSEISRSARDLVLRRKK